MVHCQITYMQSLDDSYHCLNFLVEIVLRDDSMIATPP